MFAFTKEQKQAKLAKANIDNYNKLSSQLQHSHSSDLHKEAISNAMADIVDIFTLLRSTYDLSKPAKTLDDYRLLRVPGMPGIVLNYKWTPTDLKNGLISYYLRSIEPDNLEKLVPFLAKAITQREHDKCVQEYKILAEKYSITCPFSPKNYNTLLSLLNISFLHRPISNNMDREICQQFAHTANKDILYQFKGN